MTLEKLWLLDTEKVLCSRKDQDDRRFLKGAKQFFGLDSLTADQVTGFFL